MNETTKYPINAKEGDLYKEIEVCGERFTLRYGYYEECDRVNPLCRPIPIYPDFLAMPLYTAQGVPFATEIQDACEHFKGKGKRDENSVCGECAHYKHGEDWIGLCECKARSGARSAKWPNANSAPLVYRIE